MLLLLLFIVIVVAECFPVTTMQTDCKVRMIGRDLVPNHPDRMMQVNPSGCARTEGLFPTYAVQARFEFLVSRRTNLWNAIREHTTSWMGRSSWLCHKFIMSKLLQKNPPAYIYIYIHIYTHYAYRCKSAGPLRAIRLWGVCVPCLQVYSLAIYINILSLQVYVLSVTSILYLTVC